MPSGLPFNIGSKENSRACYCFRSSMQYLDQSQHWPYFCIAHIWHARIDFKFFGILGILPDEFHQMFAILIMSAVTHESI